MSAMYYLSRGAAPEGPFEEARLVQMIQSGELTQGGACLVGQNQWLSLDAFPAFAQAFAARSAANAGYAPQAPPPGAGYAPHAPPPGAGYGAPPAAAPQVSAGANYGAPAQNYGAPNYAPAQANVAQGGPAVAAKKRKRGLLIGLALGVLFFVLGGIALGAYFIFFSSGGARAIAQSVPRDCELLVELPSVRKLVLDLHDVQFLDTSLRDDKKVFDSSADSIAKAFDISPSDATSLLTSVETSGIAARKLESVPEGVIAFGMRAGAPVEALLKSSRFAAAGAVGQTGRRYLLTKKQLASSVGQDILLKTLADAEIGATQNEQLVWFPSQKVLVLGSAPLVAELAQVLESGAASIEQNPAYQAAKKDFDSGARMTAFVDPGALSNVTDPKVKQLVSEYFTPAGPLTSSFRVKSAGFVSSFVGHVSGSKLPHDAAYEAPQALNLPDQLQAETFAYVALSTRTKLSGAETEQLLFDQIGAVEPHAKNQAEQGLREMEQTLGVSFSKLIDGAGGQAALGVAASSDTRLDQLGNGPAAATHFNLTFVQELKDDSEFKKLAAGLKQKILPSLAREVTITEDGSGFSLAPKSPPLPLSLRVKFFDKHLFVTAGANALCDRAEAAFSKGTGSLKADAAHQASLAALPDTVHFRVWLDTGRILDTLEKTPLVKARLVESGIPLDKITLTGPTRVVTALSLRGEVQNEIWTFRLDALNLQALAPFGAGAEALAGMPALQQAF